MEFEKDKLCLRLLQSKQRHSTLSKKDKLHLKFLNEEGINIQGDVNTIDNELSKKGYVKKVYHEADSYGQRVIKISNSLTNKTNEGIDFYSKHSESIKNNQEIENQFFVMLKNYWWLLGVALLLALYFL